MPFRTDPASPVKIVSSLLYKAGWLRVFGAVGQGYEFHWTNMGLNRILLLRKLIEHCGLAGSEERLRQFMAECIKKPLLPDPAERTAAWSADEACREFWVACLEELSLDFDSDLVVTLVGIVTSEDSESKAGSGISGLAIDPTIALHSPP